VNRYKPAIANLYSVLPSGVDLQLLQFFSAIFISMIIEQIIRRAIHQFLDEKEQGKFKKPRKYSKSYCEKTPCDKMGFTQKASCRPYKNCYK
jgi:hypothetical protein